MHDERSAGPSESLSEKAGSLILQGLPPLSLETLHLYRERFKYLVESSGPTIEEDVLIAVEQCREDLLDLRKRTADKDFKDCAQGIKEEGSQIQGLMAAPWASEDIHITIEHDSYGLSTGTVSKISERIKTASEKELLKMISLNMDPSEKSLFEDRMSGRLQRVPVRQDLVDLYQRSTERHREIAGLREIIERIIIRFIEQRTRELNLLEKEPRIFTERAMLIIKGRVYLTYANRRGALVTPQDFDHIIKVE